MQADPAKAPNMKTTPAGIVTKPMKHDDEHRKYHTHGEDKAM
jgi:hypothetical protein